MKIIFTRYILLALLVNFFCFLIYSLFIFFKTFDSDVLAFIFAAFVVLPLSYISNRNLVFASENEKWIEFQRFLLTYVSFTVIGAFGLQVFKTLIENSYLAQVSNIATLGLTSFLIHTCWTFKQPN